MLASAVTSVAKDALLYNIETVLAPMLYLDPIATACTL